MFGISPAFLDFLGRLEDKKEGEPLIDWQESLDFLIVFIGDGDGDRYEEFRVRHNETRHEYHASELFEKWLERFPATDLDRAERVRRALRRQNPSIHIPL